MKPYAIISGIAVVLVIIGMPFISYFYLRGGLTFRINALEALKQTEEEQRLTEQIQKDLTIKKGVVNVLVNNESLDDPIEQEIYDKFKGNKFFFMHTIQRSDQNSGPVIIHDDYYTSDVDTRNARWLDKNDIILIDTSGQVRQTYSLGKDELRIFVQQLSVLLPVEASKKILLERG